MYSTQPKTFISKEEITNFFTPQEDFSIYEKKNLDELFDLYKQNPHKKSKFCLKISKIITEKIDKLDSIDEPLDLLSIFERVQIFDFRNKTEEVWVRNFKKILDSLEEISHKDSCQISNLIKKTKIDRLPRNIAHILETNQKKIERAFL